MNLFGTLWTRNSNWIDKYVMVCGHYGANSAVLLEKCSVFMFESRFFEKSGLKILPGKIKAVTLLQ